MTLADMLAHDPGLTLATGQTGAELLGLTADSRAVAPGFLFAALPGARADGRRFIAEAVARGASAVLAPEGTEWPPGIPPRPLLTAADPRRAFARMAAAHYALQPATVVAITGTNGKTSTAEFLRQIWSRQVLGGQASGGQASGGQASEGFAASLGTLGLSRAGQPATPGLTTPDPVALHATLAALARDGVRHLAMEASSHGLDQRRLDGVRLAAGAFSNLSRDHLDYHADMAAYRTAKLRLFDTLLPEGAPAVANADMDAETLAALTAIAHRRRLRLTTVGEAGEDIRLLAATPLPEGLALELAAFGTRHALLLPLVGRVQAENAMLAAGLAAVTGVAAPIGALSRLVGVRGRMERVARLANGATIYVDFAHTAEALARLLAALAPHATGRVVVVFGAGGDRDPGKRPLMGAAVAAGADLAFVTDDNPRGEDPAMIRAAILAACPGAIEIGDRAQAIAAAMAALRPGDVLAIAGKGHETGQTIGATIGATILPFDDAAVVRGLL